MGQIRRFHDGTLTIPARILTDIENTLGMYDAAPRGRVVNDRAAVAALEASPEGHYESTLGKYHDLYTHAEVDAVQSLRGWNRLRHGSISVDAYLLCQVRNLLDDETYRRNSCEDWVEELRREATGDPWPGQETLLPELAFVDARMAANLSCMRCDWCRVVTLRDVIDDLLDAAGFKRHPYLAYLGESGNALHVWDTVVASSEVPAEPLLALH